MVSKNTGAHITAIKEAREVMGDTFDNLVNLLTNLETTRDDSVENTTTWETLLDIAASMKTNMKRVDMLLERIDGETEQTKAT